MGTPLANSASAERGAYFGHGADDPDLRARYTAPVGTVLPLTQPDTPAGPVERIPSRPATSRVAVSFPFDPVRHVHTGLHGSLESPDVGALGPDTQPPREAFRRQRRNAPSEPWDEGTEIAPDAAGVRLPRAAAASPYGFL